MNPKPGTTPDGIRWAHALLAREAGGEMLDVVACEAWREVLGFAPNEDAKQALAVVRAAA